MSSAKLEATGQRWVFQQSDFNFSIGNKPGSINIDADVMSRYPHKQIDRDQVSIDSETITVICHNSLFSVPVVKTLPSCSMDIIDCAHLGQEVAPQIELRQLRKSQWDDPVVGVWLRATKDKCFPSKKDIAGSNDHLTTMPRHFNIFLLNVVCYTGKL